MSFGTVGSDYDFRVDCGHSLSRDMHILIILRLSSVSILTEIVRSKIGIDVTVLIIDSKV